MSTVSNSGTAVEVYGVLLLPGPTLRKLQKRCSGYSAPLGRPELPEVYIRLTKGSAGRPSLPGITSAGFLPDARPTANTSSMVVSFAPAGRFACISANAPDDVTASVELHTWVQTCQHAAQRVSVHETRASLHVLSSATSSLKDSIDKYSV